MEDEVEVEYEVETFDIGSFRFNIHTIAYLPIEILLRNQSQGVEISGQKLWCGSMAVAQYVYDHPDIIRDRVVLELGAGTGVLGMLCHRMGCQRVILTDNDRISIDHMISDCKSNDIIADVVSLDWFNFDIEKFDVLQSLPAVDVLVVAGDVLYKKSLLGPFFHVVQQFFNKYKGHINMILCHVPRADVNQSDVIEAVNNSGLSHTIIDASEWRKDFCIELTPKEDYDRAQVYRLS